MIPGWVACLVVEMRQTPLPSSCARKVCDTDSLRMYFHSNSSFEFMIMMIIITIVIVYMEDGKPKLAVVVLSTVRRV
jgi:hypothetical protein